MADMLGKWKVAIFGINLGICSLYPKFMQFKHIQICKDSPSYSDIVCKEKVPMPSRFISATKFAFC